MQVRSALLLSALCSLLVAFESQAAAQTATAFHVSGNVIGEDGLPVPNAELYFDFVNDSSSPTTGFTHATVFTDANGAYAIDFTAWCGQMHGPAGTENAFAVANVWPRADYDNDNRYILAPDQANTDAQSINQNFRLRRHTRIAAGASVTVTISPEDAFCTNNVQDMHPWPEEMVCRTVWITAPVDGTLTVQAVATGSTVAPALETEMHVDPCCYEALANPRSLFVPAGTAVMAQVEMPWGSATSSFLLQTTWSPAAAGAFVPQTGWWWDPQLSGIGFFIENGGTSGNGTFVGGFFYDRAGGRATWLVSTGPTNGPNYTSTWLNESGGQTLMGAYQQPAPATNAGGVTIAFSDATHAVMTLPVGSKISLQRFSFTSSTTPAPPIAGAPQSGWWWGGPAMSGTGYGIEIQGSSIFIVAYVYDDVGNPMWYLSSGTLTSPTTYTGTWDVYAAGPALDTPEGSSLGAQKIGAATPMSLTFTDATHGTLTMGSVMIPITRFQGF